VALLVRRLTVAYLATEARGLKTRCEEPAEVTLSS
jgi:hypothetical protein